MNKQLSINIFLYRELLKEPFYYDRKIAANSVDLFTPSGFFLLWEKAQGEEWWEHFCSRELRPTITINYRSYYIYINPLTFPTLLAEYLGWKEAR